MAQSAAADNWAIRQRAMNTNGLWKGNNNTLKRSTIRTGGQPYFSIGKRPVKP